MTDDYRLLNLGHLIRMGLRGRFGLSGLPLFIYQQILGVVGAFALVAFLGNFVEVDWRGILESLISVWNDNVRPAVRFVSDILIVWPLRHLVHWEIHIPQFVSDYVAVGMMLFLSSVRVDNYWKQRSLLLKFREPIIHYFLNLLIDLLAWPLVVALLIARILGLIKFDHRLYEMPAVILRMAWAMSLVPLFWFALLLAANYLLLKPGS